jgi:hypothetical protein
LPLVGQVLLIFGLIDLTARRDLDIFAKVRFKPGVFPGFGGST